MQLLPLALARNSQRLTDPPLLTCLLSQASDVDLQRVPGKSTGLVAAVIIQLAALRHRSLRKAERERERTTEKVCHCCCFAFFSSSIRSSQSNVDFFTCYLNCTSCCCQSERGPLRKHGDKIVVLWCDFLVNGETCSLPTLLCN